MTYWAREHQANLRIIGDCVREIDMLRDDSIPNLMRDLADDDYDATQDTRARLTEARQHLAGALQSLDEAKRQLPTPRSEGSPQRPPDPSSTATAAEPVMRADADATHPGVAAAEPVLPSDTSAEAIMEREG